MIFLHKHQGEDMPWLISIRYSLKFYLLITSPMPCKNRSLCIEYNQMLASKRLDRLHSLSTFIDVSILIITLRHNL